MTPPATAALSAKISSSILKGRQPVKRQTVVEKPINPEEAIATVEKFANLLDALSEARKQMDQAQRLAKDVDGVDLAVLIEGGKDLPDLGRISGDAQAAQLKAQATLKACNRSAANARAALVRLSQLKRDILAKLLSEARASIQRPDWISDAEFEGLAARHPAVQALAAFQWINLPSFPLITAEGGTHQLPAYRVTEFTQIQKAGGHQGDSFSPSQLASSLRAWLKHFNEVVAYTPQNRS